MLINVSQRNKIFQIAKTCLSSKNARHSKKLERLAWQACVATNHITDRQTIREREREKMRNSFVDFAPY